MPLDSPDLNHVQGQERYNLLEARAQTRTPLRESIWVASITAPRTNLLEIASEAVCKPKRRVELPPVWKRVARAFGKTAPFEISAWY